MTDEQIEKLYRLAHTTNPLAWFIEEARALLSTSKPACQINETLDARIREIFLANGFTIKEGQTDLKPYVYQAAHALLWATGVLSLPSAVAQSASYVDIVFAEPHDQAASHEFTFVEVEDEQRHSIRFGKWLKRDDGYWVLRIDC